MSGESPFLGEERWHLVDDLEERFRDVERSASPQIVTIEAESGWGKTRLLHELYRRLAADQTDPAYWPAAIIENADAKDVRQRRKVLAPAAARCSSRAAPPWFWWGISAATTNASGAEGLANDLSQISGHQDALQRSALQRMSRIARTKRRLLQQGEGLVDTSAGEAVGIVAGAANVAFPGLGFVVYAATKGVRATIDFHQAREDDDEDPGAADARERQAIEVTADAILEIADTVPIVLAVEDAFQAGPGLAQLLNHIGRAESGRVLVILTGWPGTLDDPARDVNDVLRAAPAERLTRWQQGTEPVPEAPRALGQLSTEDREALVLHLFPTLDAASARVLAERFANPYALEQIATHARVRREIKQRSGSGHERLLTDETIVALPATLRGLLEDEWQGLPQSVRTALIVATLSTPASIDPEGSKDHRWAPGLLQAVAAQTFLVEEILDSDPGDVEEISAALGRAASDFRWVLEVGWSQGYRDPMMRRIATDEAARADGLDRASVRELLETLGATASRWRPADDDELAFRSYLLLALTVAGLLEITDESLDEARFLLRDVRDVADRSQIAARIGRLVPPNLRSTPAAFLLAADGLSAGAWANRLDRSIVDELAVLADEAQMAMGDRSAATAQVLDRYSTALVAQGLSKRADVVRERAEPIWWHVVEDRVASPLATIGSVIWARGRLARALESGRRWDAAVAVREALVADYELACGDPDDERVLRARRDHAAAISSSGKSADAIERYESLAVDRARLHGEDDERALRAGLDLASALLRAGQHGRAIALHEALLTLSESLADGPDGEPALRARRDLAHALQQAREYPAAIAVLETLVVSAGRAYGDPDDERVLRARRDLAQGLTFGGRRKEAVEVCESLFADGLRIYGDPDDERVLRARRALADALNSAGEHERALAMHESIVADVARLSEDTIDDRVLRARNDLAVALERAGERRRLIEVRELMVADATRAYGGSEHKRVLATRRDLARAFGSADEHQRQVEVLEALVADHIRIDAGHDDDRLDVRQELARALDAVGNHRRAAEVHHDLARDLVRSGENPDGRRVLMARQALAETLHRAGEHHRAIEAREDLITDLTRIDGDADGERVLLARRDLGLAHHRAGDGAGTVTVFEQLLSDRVRICGNPDDERVLEARRELAQAVAEAGDPEGAIRAFEDLVDDYARIHADRDHPRVLQARQELAEALHDVGRHGDAVEVQASVAADHARIQGTPADAEQVQEAQRALATSLQRAGNHERATAIHETLVAEAEGDPRTSTWDVLTARLELTKALLEAGWTSRAQAVHDASRASVVEAGDDNCWIVFAESAWKLGNAGLVEQAREDLLSALAVIIDPYFDLFLRQSLDRLGPGGGSAENAGRP